MSRETAASDWDYFEECNRPARSIPIHCRDCGEVVWIGRDEEYPGPALRCQSCEDAAAVTVPKGDAA